MLARGRCASRTLQIIACSSREMARQGAVHGQSKPAPTNPSGNRVDRHGGSPGNRGALTKVDQRGRAGCGSGRGCVRLVNLLRRRSCLLDLQRPALERLGRVARAAARCGGWCVRGCAWAARVARQSERGASASRAGDGRKAGFCKRNRCEAFCPGAPQCFGAPPHPRPRCRWAQPLAPLPSRGGARLSPPGGVGAKGFRVQSGEGGGWCSYAAAGAVTLSRGLLQSAAARSWGREAVSCLQRARQSSAARVPRSPRVRRAPARPVAPPAGKLGVCTRPGRAPAAGAPRRG